MNKIYKIVWNKALGQMVVVSENAKSAAKGTTVGTHLSRPLHKTQNVSACPQWLLCSLSLSMVLLANAAWAGVANTALPTGANITQGSAQISQNNNSLNINQNSQNLSTNWNTFNIGKDATVNFNQPNQSSIAVNRVLDNNASQIMGKLNANGQVFLLNPNGVIFSKTAQVNVGGLVASTLNLSDSDIAQGKFTLKNSLENQGNAGSVENYGSIIANGGVVALIAPTVKNHGTIQAHNGTVHLTAADQVTLQLQDGSLVEYQIDLGTLQGLVENGGAIQTDNGAVYLTAKAKNSLSQAVVNHTGIIEANRLEKNAKGEIILLGDMQTGTTTVSGVLKAEGKNGQDGGFIETSAANIQIQDSTKVSTLSDSGKTGEWLIDPFNVTISNQAQAGNNNVANTFTPSQNDSIINVGTLNSALASNNITVTTAGAGTQAGNINVNADVTWSANTALTLRADNDIHINANITATNNNGKLNLQYGQTTSNINANYYLNNGAKVNLKAGQNFSTQKGANAPINYTVITDLGAAGSTTRTDLQGMSGDLLWNYVLGADINAATTSGWNAGLGFNPIGTQGNEFKGKFDGLNHTISNLNINRANQYYVGLFGATNNATIQNIGLIQANIKGYNRVGALIGEANFTNTSNAFSTGQVKGYQIVGGLVGANQNQSSILSSYSNAQVTATDSFAGGLSGANEFSSRIENSYATGAVQAQGSNSNAGGLSGNNYSNSVIKNSYATGAVSGIERVGGLLGNNDSSTVENSYATGQVTKTSGSAITFGGLVGWSGGTIKNSYWNSATTGQTQAVGDNSGNLTSVVGLTTAQMFDKNSLSGFDFDIIWGNGDNQTTPYLKNHIGLNNVINKNDTVAGASYAVIQTLNQLQGMSGNLSGKYVLGADIDATATSGWNNGQGFNPIGNSSNRFTGKFDGLNHTISNLTINRQSQDYVGLFGATNNSTIQNIGLIQANVRGSWRVGALIGEANYTNTSNAFSTGQVNGFRLVGGLVGFNQNQSNILSSYSNAQVTATDSFAGGLSGANQLDSRIENSYATGAVQAQGSNSNAGGLSGNNYSNSVIKNSYATGAVSGIDAVGGLLGNNNSSTVENSYATGQVSISTGTQQGGLVGRTGGTIKNSYWNKDTTGQGAAVGDATGTLTQVQGLTTAQMKQGASFVGFNIDGQGGTAKVWRIYEGNTAPLLRSFLTQADISATANQTKAYNGQIQGLDTTIFTGLDSSKIFSSNSSSKNVGTYNVGYYSNQQGYDFIGGSASLTINKADLAITGLSAGDKVYDATTVATLTGTASVSPLGSDSVTLGGTGIANFADKNVGTHKTVTVSGYTLSGADAGNYSLVQPTGLKANISKADLALTGLSAGNKVYDATTVATLTGTASVSPLGSDSVTLGGTGIANFADKNVGTHKTVTVSGYTLSGADAGNYSLVQPTGGLKADITPATLTYTANAATSIYGDAITGLTGTVAGFVNGENLANATTGTASFSTAATATSHVGQYAIAGSGLTANNGNYVFAQNAANTTALTINPATLTITANAGQHKVYGDIDPTLGYAVSGWKLSDDNSLLTGALGRASGENAGLYAMNKGTVAAGGNYTIAYNSASPQFEITPAPLTITANAGQHKVYGDTDPTLGYGVSGWKLSDGNSLLTGALGRASGENAGLYAMNKGTVAAGGNYTIAYNSASPQFEITPAPLTITANAGQHKVYGDIDPTLAYAVSGWKLSDDNSLLTGALGRASGENAGLYAMNKGTVAAGGNYTIAYNSASPQFEITPAPLTITANAGQHKVYGDIDPTLGYAVSGWKLSDDQSLLTGALGRAAGKNVGNYAINQGSLLATSNYDISYIGADFAITPRTLTATINAQNKVYDGNSSAAVIYGDNRVSGDFLSITGNPATFSDKNAGSNKTVIVNGLTLSGADAGNYELASTTATTQADIDKATLTATITAQNKIYDGNTSASVSYGDDRIGQDVLVVSGTATFSDKNAATGKTVTATGLALTGTDAGNYELASTTATTQADIDKATLTATITAQNKIYDGNTSASVSYGDDRIGQDVLVVSGTATFNDKNAATGKTVTATGLALTGTDAGNYELASTTATTQADIDKATLTATITAQNKIYDGNTSASVSYGDDRIGQDVLVVSGTATFSDKNAATGKTVTATGLALTGTDAGNYELASTTATTQADIDKATLTATITAQNKIYDGNNSASVSYGDDRIGQDVLVVSGTATFNDKNAATGKTVTANNLALTGTDAGNYELASTTATTQADIDKATLTATITAQNKIYDGNNSASVSYGDDRIGQDVLVVSGTATFSDKNAATGKTVTATGLALTGTDAGNYELASTTATTQADIDKATLTATITAQNKIYDGNNSASVSYGDDRIGQDVLVVSGTATFSDKNAATGKTVTATGLALTGTDAGNYELASTTATTQADIDKATLTATITAQNKIYDGNNSASVSYGDDRIGQDVLVVSGTATFSDKNAATGKTVTATGLALTGTDAGNYELASTTATTQADIDKATLTATITAQNKIYDGNNSASVSYGDDRIGQDVLVVSGTATFSDKNAGSNKTVIVNGLTLSGADAGNYVLAATTATDTADISKAQAIVTANSLNTVYNGQNQTASGFSATGLVNGEDSSVLTGVTASVTAKDAGSYTNKANGVDKNYDLTFVDGALEIAKAKATVTANSLNTVYNGKDQTVTGFTASGLVNGETEAVLSGVTATVTGKNAGSYINTATGTDGNYDITFVDGALEIAKAKATITANSLNTVYNGQNQTASGFSATGLVNGEDSSVLTGVTASVTAKDAGSYTNKANGVDKNYDLTFVDGALEIAKAKATVTANSLNTVYNGKDQTVTGFTASGLVAGEDEAVLSNVSASVTAQEVGNYANKATGSDDNYELTFVDGVLSIQAKPIVPVPPQPPVVPSYYPIWGNPYQRAIRTQSVQQKTKAFDIVEIEIEGNGINMDNIQTLGSN